MIAQKRIEQVLKELERNNLKALSISVNFNHVDHDKSTLTVRSEVAGSGEYHITIDDIREKVLKHFDEMAKQGYSQASASFRISNRTLNWRYTHSNELGA